MEHDRTSEMIPYSLCFLVTCDRVISRISARLIKQVRRERAQKLKKMAERASGDRAQGGFQRPCLILFAVCSDDVHPKEKCS